MIKNYLKKADYLVIILILMFSLSLIIKNSNKFSDSLNNYVSIKVNGKEFKKISLDKDTRINIDNEFGHNIIKIKNKNVFMEYSDCKDKVCKKIGKINKTGETIVCLPNRIVISILKNNDKYNNLDVIVY